MSKNERQLLNQNIRATEVRLITDNGQEVVSKEDALKMAQEEGLDLLVVSPNVIPPVAKILDYGHYRYEKEKKEKETKKKSNQKGNTIKELKLTPRIGDHDFNVRVTRGREFLSKGYKVKLTIFFKGREVTHQELGHTMIKRFLAAIEDLGWAENPDIRPRLVNRFMSILIVAGKKRSVTKEEGIQQARDEQQKAEAKEAKVAAAEVIEKETEVEKKEVEEKIIEANEAVDK